MKRGIKCFVLAGFMSALAYYQTSAETAPAFEVASVKPATNPESALRIDSAAVRCTCPLDVLIMYAYEIKPYQLRGPSWITETRIPYQVDANIPKKSTKEQIPAMVRGLLAERFHLSAHRESRESPVYALTLDQGGLKFAVRPAQEPSQPTPQAPQFRSYIDITTGRIHYEGILTLKQFANLLTGMMDRPVVNITGADGEFDILFDARIPVANLKPIPVFILPDGRKLGGQRVEPPEAQYITLWDGRKLPGDAPSIFSAIRKLGLSLEPGRAALEYLIIDKVDKTPTEN